MACNLSAGRNEVCKESIGGLQGVYFINFTTGSFTTNGNGEVTAVPSGSTLYYYELKGTSAYTETVNSSREDLTAGTIQTGAAMGDLYGYSATFTGMEKLPAAFISGSTTTSALGGLTANYTVVYGTNS